MNHHWRSPRSFWVAFGLALPLAYASSLIVQGGAPVAEACTPWMPPDPGVSGLFSGAVLTVGRDGFFPFAASGYDVNSEAVLEAIDVEVRDRAGELMPGALEILLSIEREQAPSEFVLNWIADEPLPTDEQLSVRLSVIGSDPLVSSDATLTVKDQTAPLTLPDLKFQDWERLILGTGETRTCMPNSPGWCGPIEYGVEVERLLEAAVQADDIAEPPVASVWEYTLSDVPGKGELAAPMTPVLLISNGEPNLVPFYPKFRGDLEEYCVEVTVRDLRTDETLSEKYCSTPPDSVTEFNADPIKSCDSVPPEFLSRWCEGRDSSFNPSCPDAGTGGNGAGGNGTGGAGAGTGSSTGGSAGGNTAGTGGVPTDPPPAAGTAGTTPASGGTGADTGNGAAGEDAGDGSEVTTVVTEGGCGCRVIPRGGRHEAGLSVAVLGMFGVLWARRRRFRAKRDSGS